MKKIIIETLAAFVFCFTLTSCVKTAQAQIDDVYDDNVDINLVITYGTPYYNVDGLLLYYIYDNLYYYPYYYHNRYYLHRYHRPIPPHWRNRYRPVPRDFYKHNPHHDKHFGGHKPKHKWGNGNGSRPHNGNGVHGNRNGGRPHGNMNHSTPRPNRPNAHIQQHRPSANRGSVGASRPMQRPSSQGRHNGGFGGRR